MLTRAEAATYTPNSALPSWRPRYARARNPQTAPTMYAMLTTETFFRMRRASTPPVDGARTSSSSMAPSIPRGMQPLPMCCPRKSARIGPVDEECARVVASRIHRAPHQLVRYAPVLRACRMLPPGARVLAVGAGGEGLGTWYRRPFVGADPAFVGPRLPTLLAVAADGTRLPFADRTFDLVACVDVLPELPEDVIASMCVEMARVA